jgi:lincosamide nucleotidyltransferase A/C/D/E
MVNQTDALEIISYAEENGITVWLDGGWGVDALLEEQTRPHNDIDLFVEERHGEKYIEILKERGFAEVTEAYTTPSHTVWKDAQGRIIQRTGPTCFRRRDISARGVWGYRENRR